MAAVPEAQGQAVVQEPRRSQQLPTVQDVPEQHGSSSPPQWMHVSSTQSPSLHVPLGSAGQQLCPRPPHAKQRPLARSQKSWSPHAALGAAQQASPRAPHGVAASEPTLPVGASSRADASTSRVEKQR